MAHEHVKPQSFHGSPQEAMKAPQEEFLYLACLHEGTGVEKPDFLAVVDAEQRRGSSTRRRCRTSATSCTTSAGTAARSACHGPDRSHLIVPGFRSSRIHIVDVADDPRRPRIEKVIEPEEIVAKTGLHAAAHRPLHARRQRRRSRCSATPTATAPAASPCSTRRRSRSRAAGRTAARRRRFNYDFWYQPRKNVLVSSRVGRAEHLQAGLRPGGRRRRQLRQPAPLLGPRASGGSSRRSTSARPG